MTNNQSGIIIKRIKLDNAKDYINFVINLFL